MSQFRVGDRVTSIYGNEWMGTVIKVGSFSDGQTYYQVKSDGHAGFVWIGLPMTTLALASMS